MFCKCIKFMKYSPFPFTLCLTISLFLLGCSNSSASEKNDDSNGTADKAEKNSDGKKKEYKTIEAVQKEIRVTLSLEGYFEDPDALPFSIDTTSWSEIKVLTPPVHGKTIQKGERLIEIDLEKINKKRKEMNHELSILNLNQEILASELKRDEQINKIELEKINRMEQYNREEFERYKNIELPYEKKSAVYDLKRYEENLSYVMEELIQLRKMYEADDLTEETEEIILQRTQNDVNRMKFTLEGAKIRKDKALKLEIPQSMSEKQDSFEKKILTHKTNRIIKPVELKKKKLEMRKIEEEKVILSENKLKLEKDLLKLKATSPIAGTLFVGTFDRGKWSGSKLFETKLKKGGLIKQYEEFVTICPGKNIQARIRIPEKSLVGLSGVKKGKLIPGTNPDQNFNANIIEIRKFPIEPKSYDAVVRFTIPDGEKPPLPGSSCTLKIITYQNKNAITLPLSSVFKEDHDPEVRYVYLLSAKGKPVKKIVKTGKTSGENIEIVKGIRLNTKILKEKPEA